MKTIYSKFEHVPDHRGEAGFTVAGKCPLCYYEFTCTGFAKSDIWAASAAANNGIIVLIGCDTTPAQHMHQYIKTMIRPIEHELGVRKSFYVKRNNAMNILSQRFQK